MVQVGAHLERCSECGELKICGEFWNVEPRFRAFWCVDCLEKMLAGVRAAAARCVSSIVRRA